jgi:hypothetical protein
MVALALVLTAPMAAWACPVCASGQSQSTWVETALVAGMIAAPLIIAGLVIRWLRRALRAAEGQPPR